MASDLDIRIDAGALAKLSRAWRDAPELVVDEMTTSVWEASLLVEREVKERTPIGVGGGGGLAGSIAAREPRSARRGGHRHGGHGASLRHPRRARALRPGQRQPPLAPLADWAVAKLGVSHAEAMRVSRSPSRARLPSAGPTGAHMFRDGAKGNRGRRSSASSSPAPSASSNAWRRDGHERHGSRIARGAARRTGRAHQDRVRRGAGLDGSGSGRISAGRMRPRLRALRRGRGRPAGALPLRRRPASRRRRPAFSSAGTCAVSRPSSSRATRSTRAPRTAGARSQSWRSTIPFRASRKPRDSSRARSSSTA